MAEGWEPYGITTEAGKALFTRMNMEQGSSVWGPVGEGIVAVEREVQERIIALLEADIAKCDWEEVAKDILSDEPCEECDQTSYLIALIKGENK